MEVVPLSTGQTQSTQTMRLVGTWLNTGWRLVNRHEQRVIVLALALVNELIARPHKLGSSNASQEAAGLERQEKLGGGVAYVLAKTALLFLITLAVSL